MADQLEDGVRFQINTYTLGNLPVGVEPYPTRVQPVRFGAPLHGWSAERVGIDTYKFSVSGYGSVGVDSNGKVIASQYPQDNKVWKVRFHQPQAAWTIALADKPDFGWSILIGGGTEIVIGRITETSPSHFVPQQLFLLNVDKDDE